MSWLISGDRRCDSQRSRFPSYLSRKSLPAPACSKSRARLAKGEPRRFCFVELSMKRRRRRALRKVLAAAMNSLLHAAITLASVMVRVALDHPQATALAGFCKCCHRQEPRPLLRPPSSYRSTRARSVRSRKSFPSHVSFRLANDLPYLFLTRIFFNQRDGSPELDGILGKLRHVDDFGTCELVF